MASSRSMQMPDARKHNILNRDATLGMHVVNVVPISMYRHKW